PRDFFLASKHEVRGFVDQYDRLLSGTELRGNEPEPKIAAVREGSNSGLVMGSRDVIEILDSPSEGRPNFGAVGNCYLRFRHVLIEQEVLELNVCAVTFRQNE